MAKRIMRAFKIDEISGVDRPAQAHAKVAILKRDFTDDERKEMADKGEAMKDGSYPIANVSDLENAIQAFGRAKNKGPVKAHIIRRAKALGASDKIPDDWKPNTAKLAKDIYAGVASSSGNPPGPRSFADLFAATEACQRQYEISQELWPYFDALTDSIRSIVADTASDDNAKVSAINTSIDQFRDAVIAEIPDAEEDDDIEKLFTDLAASVVKHAGYVAGDQVSKEKSMSDNTQKVADLEKSVADLTKSLAEVTKAKDEAEAKVAEMTKAAEIAKNDETFSADGVTIRKSEVGEASFKFMKAQQERIELAEMQKRAETEIAHLPGEPVAKAKVLKAINAMGEDDRKALDAMLKAGEAAIAKGFTKFGVPTGGANADDPVAKLETLAKAHAAKEGISYAKAYTAVLDTDEGKALYAESRKAA